MARGQALVTALVTSVIMGIVMMGFLSMFKNQGKATQQITAWEGVNDLSHSLDLLFGNVQCQTTGQFTNAGAAGAVTLGSGGSYNLVLDTISFPSGTIAVTTGADMSLTNMLRPYSIAPLNPANAVGVCSGVPNPSGICFTPLGASGPYGAGYSYAFQMQVYFQSSSGPAPLPLNKFVMVFTNAIPPATQTITGMCTYQSSSIRPTTMVVFSTPGSVAWTVPANVSQVKVRLVGGGGSGGPATATRGGGGGGAGGYCEGLFPVVAGTSITIVVGAGGTPNAVNNNVSGTGGASSFGTGLCLGNGGGGGNGNDCCSAGAPGGSASGGLLNLQGGFGQDTANSLPAGPSPCGGPGSDGGASYFGGAGRGGTRSGFTGASPGTGGGAAYWNTTCAAGVSPLGAPGANGLVIVEY
jgi:hypothetical protein